MTATKRKNDFAEWLKFFGDKNGGRPTRLGVFVREGDTMQDYWLEDGLPLGAVVAEESGAVSDIEIMLGAAGDERRLTHSIKNAQSIKIEISLDGQKDGLEIADADGKVTILRFENFS